MSAFSELMSDVQKAKDRKSLDLVFEDVDHARSSGQISDAEYQELCAYAFNP